MSNTVLGRLLQLFFGVFEAASLPMAITAHQAQLHTLIQACCVLSTCGKTAHIYIYSAYAFKVTHDFGMLWKQHGSLSYFQQMKAKLFKIVVCNVFGCCICYYDSSEY